MQRNSKPAFRWPVALQRAAHVVDRAPAAVLLGFACVAAVLLYLPTLTNAFEFDDINVLWTSIIPAPDLPSVILQFDGQTTGGSWRPLLHVVLWLEWHSLGLNAVGYHVVNALLHGCTTFVVGAIAFELSRRKSVAWLTGAIFLVQPLPEAIAWIVAGPLNVMSALFYLAAILFHVRSRRRSYRPNAILAVMFLVLSLASYEVGLTYAGAVIAYDVLFHWSEWTNRQRLLRTGTVVLVVLTLDVLFIVTRAWIIGTLVASYGASTIFGFASIVGRLETIIRTLWSPVNGAVPTAHALDGWTLAFELALIASVAGVLVLRPPLRPFLFGLALAVCGFIPFAGFMSVNQDLSSSRYLYLSTAGIAVAIGAAFASRPIAPGVAMATCLVASSSVILAFNMAPWATAGAMVDQTVKAAASGPVQTFGVPVHDIYGAYTFGTASNIPEYPGTISMDVVTDGPVQPGRKHMYWDGAGTLRSLDVTPVIRWSASDLRTWNWASTVVLQSRDDSLIVTGSDGDPWAWSPELALPAGRASVVVAELVVPDGTCARSQLIWRYSVGADQIAYAPLEPGQHEYAFTSSAYVPGSTLVGLRFDPLVCAGSVEVLRLEVGGRSAP